MSQDITASYIVMDVERLRKPMQQITDCILMNMGIKNKAEVVKFNHLTKGVSNEYNTA